MMRGLTGWLPAALLLAFALAAVAAPPPVPPLEIYGSLPRTEAVEMSADGDMLAIVSRQDDRFLLTIRHVDGRPIATVPLDDMKFAGLSWAGNDYAVVYTHRTARLGADSKSDRELTEGIVVDANSGAQKPLLAAPPDYLSTIQGHYGIIRRDGRWFGYYGLYPTEPPADLHSGAGPRWQQYPDLCRIDFGTGTIERVAKGSPRSRSWVLDAGGEIVAESEYDSNSGDWRVFRPDKPLDALIKGNSPFRFAAAGLSRTPDAILVAEGGTDGAIKELNLKTGQAETLLPSEKSMALIRGRGTRLLLGAVSIDGGDSTIFDPTLEKHYRSIARMFAGHYWRPASVSADQNRMLVFVSGQEAPGTWELVDFPAGKATPVAVDYPEISQPMIGPVQTVDYRAADGLAIQGVLTLPPGRPARDLPLVVLVHGGPEARDLASFNWWAQAFAVRGYAVFQPNFRGSAGYGIAFRNAGFGEWGRKMQTDISDGVAFLAGKGIVDPHRACIAGASYGGYAALAGVTVQNGLYRCAASYGGVTDPHDRLSAIAERGKGRTEHYEEPGMRIRLSYMGVRSMDDPSLDAISPLKLAGKADAPILLIYGDKDTVVPPAQSQEMAEALKAAGKPVELIALDGEDHWLSRSATRLQMLKAMVAFVEKYNPADLTH